MVPTAGAGDGIGLLGQTGVADHWAAWPIPSPRPGWPPTRYDQRGTGESGIEPDVRLTLDDLVADARAALNLLAQPKETADRDLAVVGYDQGGLVALRLAATDERVKRLVLISTPGRSLVDVRAAQLAAQYGPESADALRSLVAGLLATRSVPPLDTMRTEQRPLFPAQEAAFLAVLYGLDPAAEAPRVKAATLIVVPADPAPYDPQRLAAATLAPRWPFRPGPARRCPLPGRRPPTCPTPTTPCTSTLAGDGQLGGGAEIEVRDPDGSVALLVPLARHHRVEDDETGPAVVWIRPVVAGYAPEGEPGLPPYAFHLNEARPRALQLAGLEEVGDELVFTTAAGQLVRIRPAGPKTLPELERWDTFCAVVLSAEEEAALDRVWGDSWWGDWA